MSSPSRRSMEMEVTLEASATTSRRPAVEAAWSMRAVGGREQITLR